MGTFVWWWFLREAEGQFSPLSVKKADEFLDGKLALPSPGGVVRLALVAGPTEDRRALAVRTLQFTKHKVDARGRHDRWPSMREAMEHMSVLAQLSEPPDFGHNVIAAEKWFRRSESDPFAASMDPLRRSGISGSRARLPTSSAFTSSRPFARELARFWRAPGATFRRPGTS